MKKLLFVIPMVLLGSAQLFGLGEIWEGTKRAVSGAVQTVTAPFTTTTEERTVVVSPAPVTRVGVSTTPVTKYGEPTKFTTDFDCQRALENYRSKIALARGNAAELQRLHSQISGLLQSDQFTCSAAITSQFRSLLKEIESELASLGVGKGKF